MIPTKQQIETIQLLVQQISNEPEKLAYLATNDKISSSTMQTHLFYFASEIINNLADKTRASPPTIDGLNSFVCFASLSILNHLDIQDDFFTRQIKEYHLKSIQKIQQN